MWRPSAWLPPQRSSSPASWQGPLHAWRGRASYSFITTDPTPHRASSGHCRFRDGFPNPGPRSRSTDIIRLTSANRDLKPFRQGNLWRLVELTPKAPISLKYPAEHELRVGGWFGGFGQNRLCEGHVLRDSALLARSPSGVDFWSTYGFRTWARAVPGSRAAVVHPQALFSRCSYS